MISKLSPRPDAEPPILRYWDRTGLPVTIDRVPNGHRPSAKTNLEGLGELRCLSDTGMAIARMRRYTELPPEPREHDLEGQATAAPVARRPVVVQDQLRR